MSAVNEPLENLQSKFTCCLNTSKREGIDIKGFIENKRKARKISTFLYVKTTLK